MASSGARRYPAPRGGVARMMTPDLIEGSSPVTIPVMAKARIGHSWRPRSRRAPRGGLRRDESEVLTPADYTHHIDKWKFTVPFVCGATNLGEALRRITEGAAMIRSRG